MGRALRVCSHKDLPFRERFVNVYLYKSVYPNYATADNILHDISKDKQKEIAEALMGLRHTSIECEFHNNFCL